MSKPKKQKPRERKAKSIRLDGLALAAIGEAPRLGLFVLVEAEPRPAVGPTRWLVYSKTSGRFLMTYWPKTYHYRAGGDDGHVKHWRDALALAARLDERARQRGQVVSEAG